jgi:hypothetical protein
VCWRTARAGKKRGASVVVKDLRGSRKKSSAAIIVEDPRGSGKKRGTAVIVEDPRGSGKKRGEDIVIGEEEGRGRRRQRSTWLREEGLGAALLARVQPGKKARGEEVGEKGPGQAVLPLSHTYAWRIPQRCATDMLCVAHHIGVRHACFCIVQNQPQCNLDSNLDIAQWFWFRWLFGRCQVRTLDLPSFFVFTKTIFQKV